MGQPVNKAEKVATRITAINSDKSGQIGGPISLTEKWAYTYILRNPHFGLTNKMLCRSGSILKIDVPFCPSAKGCSSNDNPKDPKKERRSSIRHFIDCSTAYQPGWCVSSRLMHRIKGSAPLSSAAQCINLYIDFHSEAALGSSHPRHLQLCTERS